MGDVVHMPPVGCYDAAEAGQLAGVSGQTIGQWARRGYIKSSRSDGRPRLYSFQDVAEAIVVHELLDRNVAHGDIKVAVGILGREYGDWPLTGADLSTTPGHGRSHLLVTRDSDDYDVVTGTWQQVISPDNLNALRNLLRRGGWAARNLPDLEHIEVNPERMGGTPTIRGTRVPAETVGRMARARGHEVVFDEYGVGEAPAADAVRWVTAVEELQAA